MDGPDVLIGTTTVEKQQIEVESGLNWELLDLLPIPVIVFGERNGCLYLNSEFENLTGYSRFETLSDFLRIVHDNDVGLVMDAVLTNSGLEQGVTIRVITQAGEERLVAMDIRKLYEYQNIIILTLTDITPFKDTSLSGISVAACMAHDIRNPLAVVKGYVELLLGGEGMNDKQRSYLERIKQAIYMMQETIIAMTFLNRVDCQEIGIEETLMGEVIKNVIDQLEVCIHESRAKIINDSEECTLVLGNERLLEIVMINLLSNAIKYGGNPPEVHIGYNDIGNGMVRFYIRDNGSGLTPQQMTQLFIPFSRFRRDVEGIGMGLVSVKMIVEKLGGQVGVESEVGKGSTFWFTLPAVKEV